MVACKFFLQGTCRFGNSCRFEHTYESVSTYEGSGGVSILRRAASQQQHLPQQSPNTFPNQNPWQQQTFSNNATHSSYVNSNNHPTFKDFIQMISTELITSEKGGQWPLSCIAFMKDKGCFPGFEDYSPEEIRLLFYEAVKSGNVEECKASVKELFDVNKFKKTCLLNPNTEMKAVIENYFKGQSSQQMSFSSTVPQSTTVSNFSFANQGQGSRNSSLFGGKTQFNSAPAGNIFGSATGPIANQSQIAFNTNIFGGSTNSMSMDVFGRASNSPLSQNVLESNMKINDNVFSNASVHSFSSTNLGNGTAPSSHSTTGSIFNSAPQPITYGSGSSAQLGMCGNANRVESTNQISQPFFTTSTSQESHMSSDVPQQNISTHIYSCVSDLTEEEKNEFQSATFSMGKVPTKPPPKELCI